MMSTLLPARWCPTKSCLNSIVVCCFVGLLDLLVVGRIESSLILVFARKARPARAAAHSLAGSRTVRHTGRAGGSAGRHAAGAAGQCSRVV